VTVDYQGPAARLVTDVEGNPGVRRTNAPRPLPAASGPAPKLFAFSSNGPGALRRLEEVGGRVDVLAPNWYLLSPADATISGGAPNAKVMALSRRLRFDVWPVVNATMRGSALIDSAAGRARISEEIDRLAARHRLAGVTLDMEEMLPRQKASLSALVAQLGATLHRRHRKLAVYAVRRTATDPDDSGGRLRLARARPRGRPRAGLGLQRALGDERPRPGARWIGLFTLGREPERFWERSAVR
jgi:hypothetical protein